MIYHYYYRTGVILSGKQKISNQCKSKVCATNIYITALLLNCDWFCFSLKQRFSNGAPQGLARFATLAFRKFTTCFLHYSLVSGVYKIGYDDHLKVIRYPTLQLLQPYSWHKTLFLACCSKKKRKTETNEVTKKKKKKKKKKKTETNKVTNLAYCFDFPCKVRPFLS